MLAAPCLFLFLSPLAHHDEEQGHFHYDLPDVSIEAKRIGGKELYDPDVLVIDGALWLAWLKHVPGLGDQLWIGCRVDGKWRSREHVGNVGPALCHPTLTANDAGRIWLSFEAQGHDGAWHVYTGAVEEGRVPGLSLVSDPRANSIDHRAYATGDGAPSFVWQEDRGGQFDVMTRAWGDEPGAIERVSESPRGDWRPDLCVDASGRTTIVWDGYAGSYDVFARRRAADGTWGDVLVVANGPNFQARPHVACAADGRLWIAWEEGGPNWGRPYVSVNKQWNNITDASGPLHRLRKLHLATLSPAGELGKLDPVPMPSLADAATLADRRPGVHELGVHYERPELALDASSRPWIVYHHYFETQLGGEGPVDHHVEQGWKLYARCLGAGGWSKLFGFDVGQHDGMQRLSIAAGGTGLALVWGTGRTDRRGEQPGRGMFLARVDAGPGSPPTPEATGRRLATALPKSPVTRAPRPERDGFQLFYGDLHRHTDLSMCFPFFDGSIEDAYRYATDVAPLDFLSITDHTRDIDRGAVQSQLWWRATKEVTRHRLAGRFFPYFGYERSHRDTDHNVISLRPDALSDYRDPLPDLWERIGPDTFTVPHTPFQGRVWEYHDDAKRPLAEIYQGLRDLVSTDKLREGLDLGYHFGFIASSDHLSTSASYACVWAPEATREAVFRSLQARRTFAATARMQLVFRSGEHWMGEIIESADAPVFQIEVLGTAPIERVEFYEDGGLAGTASPGSVNERADESPSELKTEFHAQPRPSGEHYYYVHVVQTDGNQAWSSPIWIRHP